MDFPSWVNLNFGKKKKKSILKREEMGSTVNHKNLRKYGELNFNVSAYIGTGSRT
jgi:hypothetical protein